MYEGTRHTLATNALERGATLDVVRAILRHRDRRSTERYAKLSIGAAVRQLPKR
jgi:site-specific recombinase XerD